MAPRSSLAAVAVVFVAAVAASVLASSTVHRPPVEQEENLAAHDSGAIGAMTHKVVSNTAFAASTPTIVTTSCLNWATCRANARHRRRRYPRRCLVNGSIFLTLPVFSVLAGLLMDLRAFSLAGLLG